MRDLNIEDLYKKFDGLMDDVFSNKVPVDRDNYPNWLENEIQRAVSKKRTGRYEDYLEAIDIYLNIFIANKRIWPAVMEFLYKVVICTGDIAFAYEVIVYAELFAVKCWGPYSRSFFGAMEWSQTTKRKEFESMLYELSQYPTSFISAGDPDQKTLEQMMKNSIKTGNIVQNFAARYSGQSNYTLPSNASIALSDKITRCFFLHDDFHSKYNFVK